MALSAWMVAACVALPAGSDRITAGDLARASAAFASVDPAAMAGWAPVPGVTRILRVSELRRLALRLGSRVAPEDDICVERRVAPLDPARVLAALRTQIPDTDISLIDFSRAPAPDGEIVFPPNGRRRAPEGFYWKGYVRYGGRKFPIWARLRVPATRVVVAAAALAPGRPIAADQLRAETRDGVLLPGILRAPEEALGKWPRRTIPAGVPLEARWLDQAPEVVRGDPVRVEIWSGGAHLRLDARAETTAPLGARVAVRNPANQRRFFGRVTGKGLVSARPAEAAAGETP